MGWIDAIIAELKTPMGGALSASHYRAVTFGGHALLGACAVSGGMWWLGFIIAVAYWLVKERGDLRRGGAIFDGLEDTLAVWLGTYYGPWWWPFMMVALMGYVMAMDALRKRE